MKKILIPIDFSENADRALDAAKIIADKQSTQLFILHTFETYPTDVNLMAGNVFPGIGSSDLFVVSEDLENEFKERLENYAENVRKEGFLVQTIWMNGSVKYAVDEAIQMHHPDLIVMGRTGSGGFLDKLIGTSATQVALHAPCPVMIIPPQVNPQKFTNVVYATQFEYDENDILGEVLALLKPLGSQLVLLKIEAEAQPDIQPDNQFIAQIKAELPITDGDIVYRKAKHVRSGIEAYCDETQVDLLIMSSRERSFIEEFLINPSVTKKMVVDTHIPLLIFHLK